MLRIRVTEAERALLEEAAALKSLQMSSWVRSEMLALARQASRKEAKAGLIAHGNDRTDRTAFRFGNFVAEWSISVATGNIVGSPPHTFDATKCAPNECKDFRNSLPFNNLNRCNGAPEFHATMATLYEMGMLLRLRCSL